MGAVYTKKPSERGASLVEIALILALIAIVCIAMLGDAGKKARRPIIVAACTVQGGSFIFFDCGLPICIIPTGTWFFQTEEGVCVDT